MSTLVFKSREENFFPITLNLNNVDLCRYQCIEGGHYVRFVFAAGVEDVILFEDMTQAQQLVTAVASHRRDTSDQCYTSYEGDVDDDEAADVYLDFFRQNEKIQAIKQYRLDFGVGLKEAKWDIEAMMEDYEKGRKVTYRHGYTNSMRSGRSF